MEAAGAPMTCLGYHLGARCYMVPPLRREHCFARIQDARLEGPGKMNPSKVVAKRMSLSCTSSCQTGAKHLKAGEQIPTLDWRPVTADTDSDL